MDRRSFLHGISTAFPWAFFPPMLLESCKDEEPIDPNGKKVIVVGAGISGLAAAQKLHQSGYEVLVLEAQEKVGGRIRTNRSLGVPFDEGASWIHGPRNNPITDLATKAGATTYRTDDDSVKVFDLGGKSYTDSALTTIEKQYNEALSTVEKAGSTTRSFQEVFGQLYPTRLNDRFWKYVLSSYLEFNTGGDIADLSSKYFYDDEDFSGSDVILTNGYDTITDYLAKGLTIRLNTRVTGIDYSSPAIKVSLDQEVIDADHVLVTVPLGVLKKGLITFIPALPQEKQTAIAKTNMGTVNKFLLVWDTPFWDTSLQYIGYTPATKGKFNYFLNLRKFSSTNGLMTFALGNYASLTEQMSDTEIVREIMPHLSDIYGNTLPAPRQLLRTRWGQNPASYGAYSYATNGTTTADFDTLAKDLNRRVFFAGEHTNRTYRGTVHGAYLSGLREADKIVRG